MDPDPDPTLWLTAAACALAVLAAALLACLQGGLELASRNRLRALAERGERRADAALALEGARAAAALRLGSLLAHLLAAGLGLALAARLAAFAAVAEAAGLLLLLALLGEALPRALAALRPEDAALRLAGFGTAAVALLAPPAAVLQALARLLLTAAGLRPDPAREDAEIREEIAGAIAQGHTEGAVHKEDRDRLLGALELGERTVEEVMTHRSAMEMLDADLPPQELLDRCLASAHTRLPLYRGERENVVGILHAKDLVRALHARLRDAAGAADPWDGFSVLAVATKPYFVPETTPLDDQMRQFLKRKRHVALVVDEYGTLMGLITLEDILEEIVGEITDEFDRVPDTPLRPGPDGAVTLDGSTTIRDLNRATDWALPDDEANTIAGLVIHEAQMIPAEGQAFSFHGFRFEVLKRQENRITRLRVRPL